MNKLKFTLLGTAFMLLSITSFAQPTSGTTGQLSWALSGTGNNLTLTISGNGTMPNYYYPGNDPWFPYKESIVALVIEDGVTSIGNNAFRGCTRLAAINFPNSLTTIKDQSFANCSALTSVTIPNSVTSIDEWVFMFCEKLTSITVGNSVEIIGYSFCFNAPLKHFYSLSEDPPVAYNNSSFDYASSCTLHVPVGSKSKYASADGWKEFKNIQEDIAGISNVQNTSISMYPNPTNGQLTIECRDGVRSIPTVEIYNVVGQKLYTPLNPPSRGEYSPFEGGRGMSEIVIDISHFANGMYFLKVDNKVVKFVKE